MSDLARRLRRNRELKVKIDKHTFIARRPTDAEVSDLFQKGLHNNRLHVAREYVYGWEGVTYADVESSGSSDPVPFDKEDWLDWCDDRPDFWEPIHTAVMEAYKLHTDNRKAAAKN